MKHKSLIAGMLVVIILLISCGNSDRGAELSRGNATQTEGQDMSQACEYLPTFTSLEAYEKYILAGTESEKFVTYDMIRAYGSFVSFVNYGLTKPCTQYVYYLKDANGYEFGFHVSHASELESGTELAGPVVQISDGADLRTSTAEKGSCRVGNVWYNYIYGELKNIQWEIDGRRILLTSGRGDSFADYPSGRTTLIGEMLNVATSNDAAQRVNQMVQNDEAKAMTG